MSHEQILPIETLSEGGTPPPSRIKSASDANTIADAIIYAGQDRSRLNAKLKGMFDGNAPYSPGKLRQEAQAWRANCNFMEAKAARSAALVPFYDLFSGARYYADVKTNQTGEPEDQPYWSEKITEEFDWLLRQYHGFDFHMQQMLCDLVGYGKGFLIFPDATDWQFRCVQQHKVHVPDGASASVEEIEVLVIREQALVHKLWAFIENQQHAKDIGWNVQGTINAIISAMPETETDSSTQYNYEWLQQRIKDKDLYEGVKSSTVSLRHVVVKEFDGMVSHYIIQEYKGGDKKSYPANSKEQPEQKFLFNSIGRFREFREFIAGFFLETEDGSWNGSQGLGHDIYSIMALKDRIKCSAIDLMFLRTGINLQAKTANAALKAQLIRFGPVNVIPEGFDVQESSIMGDIESPVAMDNMLDKVINANTGIFRQAPRQVGNPRTATEVNAEQQQEAILSNSAVNRFYGYLDKLYEEVYRRASNPNIPEDDPSPAMRLALKFQKRCMARGVPKKAIMDVSFVRAYRNAGNGSMFLRQQAIQGTMQLLPLLPEVGKQNFVDYALSAINGVAMASLFNPKSERQKLPNDHQALAMLENAALKSGAPVAWTPSQNDVIHAQTHLLAGSQAAQSAAKGGDMATVVTFVDAVGKHAAIHIERLRKNPLRKQEFKILHKQWLELNKIHGQLVGVVAQQQQKQQLAAQQQQAAQQKVAQIKNGQDPEIQVAVEQAKADIQLKAQKAQADTARKDAKARQDMTLKDAKAAQSIQIGGKRTPFGPSK